uniref:Uncharacterized protein n=1 Tax=Pristionchus pacificus TaxID=54126 RepID=A0A2A6C9D7_PRIPA|eukprot:PDM74769.1 hypothetical protein PRIPAC_43720 [Pristionchus pacificus]
MGLLNPQRKFILASHEVHRRFSSRGRACGSSEAAKLEVYGMRERAGAENRTAGCLDNGQKKARHEKRREHEKGGTSEWDTVDGRERVRGKREMRGAQVAQ